MSKLYEWALIRDGEIIACYRTEIGAKRAATVFGRFIVGKWAVRKVKTLFDLEGASHA